MVATRLRRRIETELAAAEIALSRAAPRRDGEAARRAAETLASLTRTLREMQRYDQDQAEIARSTAPEPPADVEAMRHALADRLERLHREHGGGSS